MALLPGCVMRARDARPQTTWCAVPADRLNRHIIFLRLRHRHRPFSSFLAASRFAGMLGVPGKRKREILTGMLTSLTRLKRLRAGWIIVLIYLLCVLAPTISFALPGSQAVAP